MATHRCSICNGVSNPEMALFEHEHIEGTIFKEIDGQTICSNCLYEVEEVEEDWASDEWDWEDDYDLYDD